MVSPSMLTYVFIYYLHELIIRVYDSISHATILYCSMYNSE